jgi:uncharacterized Ntn-hydrolase superfamily protein
VIDRYGRMATHSGAKALPVAAVAEGRDCCALGNLLADSAVPTQMVATFQDTDAHSLPERLMRALEAGLAAGGETGNEHSAGLHVCEIYDWPVVDLRVDWHGAPIGALRQLWDIYAPQQAAFIARARAPQSAPSF